MIRPRQYKNLIGLAVALCVLMASGVSHASLMVDATVAPIGGGLFHYEFSITNTSFVDLLFVTITDAPLGDGLITSTRTAPGGFKTEYDSGLGLIDFLADTTPEFPIGTTSGFSFDSAFGPVGNFTTFEAFTLASFPSPEVAGNVQTNVIPEPGTIAMLAIGLCVFALVARRKYRLSS
jgi:hypothetical protein